MKNRRKRAVFRKSYKTNNREKQSLFLPVSDCFEERGKAGVIQGGEGGENEVQEKQKIFQIRGGKSMNFGTDRPIKIWAYDSYVEIANQAAAAYAGNYPDTYFEVERKTAEEILDAIKNPEQVSETSPDIVLMHDMELKQRLGYFPELFLNLSDYQISSHMLPQTSSMTTNYTVSLWRVCRSPFIIGRIF